MHEKYRTRQGAVSGLAPSNKPERGRCETLAPPNEHTFRPHSRSRSRATRSSVDRTSQVGDDKPGIAHMTDIDKDSDDDDEQDIDEIW